jgi:hypothetical protein
LPETSEEIIATLCAEVSRNPDQVLIFVISFSGAKQVTKTVSKILVNPPRLLTMAEYRSALAILKSYLPSCLAEDTDFLPRADLERLAQVVMELQNVEEGEADRAARTSIRHLAPQLLKKLMRFGVGQS